MVLTVSLNPAVDRNCRLKKLEPGEVNRLDSVESVAGGKAVNVTKVLRQFRIPVAAVGFLGGRTGELIEETLEEMGVECHFTAVDGETRTNVNLLAADGRVTELLDPGPVITEKGLREFLKQFTGCMENCEMTVLSGSLPAGVPTDIYKSLVRLCRMAGRPVILDASGEALKKGIEAGPDLVKPNRRELETLAGRKLENREELEAAARGLLNYGIKKVIVSLGSEGILGVTPSETVWKPAKKVQVVNTVGCGDTVVASLCMSEMAGEETEIALDKAVALAAANAVTQENGRIPMDAYLAFL